MWLRRALTISSIGFVDGQDNDAALFESPADLAYRGQAKIKSRLIGNCDPDDWELPPKPRWMRWGTYNRHVQRFERYDDTIEEHTRLDAT